MKTKEKYTGVILGGCLASVLRPKLASELSGKKYFNLATHYSAPLEPYFFIKLLLEKGHPIEQIILNLESYTLGRAKYDSRKFDINVCLRENYQSDLNLRWHPYLTKNTWFEFYRPYLYSWTSLRSSYKTLFWHLENKLPPVREEKDGFWNWENNLTSLRNDPKNNAIENIFSHYKENWESDYKFIDQPAPTTIPNYIKALELIVNLAKKNNIEIIGYMPPAWALRTHTSLHVRWQGKRSAWRVRKWLELLGSFYDFALYNKKTFSTAEFINNENHTAKKGDWVLKQLFTNSQSKLYYKVTKDNFKSYVTLKTQHEYIFEKKVIPVLKKTPPEKWGEINFEKFAKTFTY
jgi:hypothetical protein